MDKTYDYIITGAGCAGLSLVMRMISSGKFTEKKILIVDKSDKKSNDRTWCFWEKENGFFESLVHMRWNKLWFRSNKYSSLTNICPYEYKMIRGIEFYKYCLDVIIKQENINFIQGNVENIQSGPNETFVIIDGIKINAGYVFNSIMFEKPVLQRKQFYLFQHFKGWVIETNENQFNSNEATLMDFRTNQDHGTCFFYVMPFSCTKALIEYTVFSEEILKNEEYDLSLKNYLNAVLLIKDYSIIEEEFGAIPMTNFNFPVRNKNIINIGTIGGNTKGSSGYTFKFIQKQSEQIIQSMLDEIRVGSKERKRKHKFYDSILLNVLTTKKLSGEKVFTDMFRKNKMTDILDFLDEESSFLQDVKIITSLPALPFLNSWIEQIF